MSLSGLPDPEERKTLSDFAVRLFMEFSIDLMCNAARTIPSRRYL